MKKMEYSKQIFLGISVMVTGVVVFSCYMIYITRNLEPLRYLIPAVFVEMGTATGFYFNKAKAENLVKIDKGSDYSDRV